MKQELHDIKNILHRLELMATLLTKQDFTTFTREEVTSDVKRDLQELTKLMTKLSSDQ